jgi:seryl-tRNA synthetase
MLDPRSLEARREEIAESCRKRGVAVDLDAAIAAHGDVSALQTQLNDVNRERNEHQKGGKGKLVPDAREAHVAEGRRLKEAVAGLETRLGEARAALDTQMASIPNFIHPDVPEGGEEAFRELRRVGEPPSFDFEVRDHLELGTQLDLLDFEGGARVAGQKFYFLKNEAVLLELALQRFALDRLIAEGFTVLATPDLARPEIVAGLGYAPRGPETQIYSLANADLCLVGTAEITLGGLHAGQILDDADLPLLLAGISHCFRTEAGSHGRESKGLYRVHQFSKVEMFAFARPEDSEALHDRILGIEEALYRVLVIPFRVIVVACGVLGAPAFR